MSAFYSPSVVLPREGNELCIKEHFNPMWNYESKMTLPPSTPVSSSCYENCLVQSYYGERYNPYACRRKSGLPYSRTVAVSYCDDKIGHFEDSFPRGVHYGFKQTDPAEQVNAIHNLNLRKSECCVYEEVPPVTLTQTVGGIEEMKRPIELVQPQGNFYCFETTNAAPVSAPLGSNAFVEEYLQCIDNNRKVYHSSESEFSDDSADVPTLELPCSNEFSDHTQKGNRDCDPLGFPQHQFPSACEVSEPLLKSACPLEDWSAKTLSASMGNGSSKSTKSVSQRLERKRMLANQQERRRMHRMNTALERLRHCLPRQIHHKTRLSKIRTLRLAINYIQSLSECLRNSN